MTFLAKIFPLFWVSTHVPNFVCLVIPCVSEIYSILGRLHWQIFFKKLFFVLLKYGCYRLISSVLDYTC